jgi:hypothetical protein
LEWQYTISLIVINLVIICDHTMEFNFRETTQYWSVEGYMNVAPTGVTLRCICRCSKVHNLTFLHDAFTAHTHFVVES